MINVYVIEDETNFEDMDFVNLLFHLNLHYKNLCCESKLLTGGINLISSVRYANDTATKVHIAESIFNKFSGTEI